MNRTILRTNRITKRYRKNTAVDNVSFEIRAGDVYGLVGRNGAGKTTLMRMITSLTQPTGGEIELFGETTVKGLSNARRKMGCVVETPALYPNMTAAQNLEYYRIARGIPDDGAPQRALETVGLIDTGKKKFRDFSLGMKQRLGLALALLTNPDFIILDEPTNGLDPMGIVEMREMIKALNTERGITFLISSHILSELSLIATRYGFIDRGKLLKELTDAELHDDCRRCLSIKVDDAAKASAILETALGAANYKVIGSAEIRLYDGFDDPGEVTYRLSMGGIKVSAISETGDNLEDYFVSLVGAYEKGGDDNA